MITEVHYNWFYCTDKDYCDEFSIYKVGEKNVLKITEHFPIAGKVPYFCLIEFLGGVQVRVFNVNKVISDTDGF